MKRQVFCAGCQAVTEHGVKLDKNNELEFTCACGRALFFPMTDDPAQLDKWLADHHRDNKGQVTVEMANAEKEKADERFKKLMGIAG